jgi:hypothetical protein
MTEEEISHGIGEGGSAAGAEGLALEGAARAMSLTGGAAGAADALLAGGAAAEGLSVGAAAVGGGAIVAGAAGAFATGYWVGEKIDNLTGASDKLSTAAVDADPERAQAAAQHWDDAGTEWSRGDHLEAIGDGAASIGDFAVGSVEAAGSAVASGAEAVGGAIADGAEAAGSAIADGAEAVWDGITDLF